MSNPNPQLVNVPGVYQAQVIRPVSGWFDESSKGTPYIKVPVKVTEGEQAGKFACWQGYLSHAARTATVRTLEDVFGTDWSWTDPNFAGKNVEIVVEEEEYKGKVSCKVRYLNSPGRSNSQSAAPKSKDEQLALSARIARQIAEEIPRGSESPGTGFKETDELGDEIPF